MSVQTVYKDGLGKPYAGMVDTMYPHVISSRNASQAANVAGFNKDYIVPGKAVRIHATAGQRETDSSIYEDFTAAEPYFMGVSTLIHTGESANDAGDTRIQNGEEFGVLESGVIWMYCAAAVNAGDPVTVIRNIPNAPDQIEANQDLVGSVYPDPAGAQPSPAWGDVTTPLPLRSLSTRSDAGLIKVRVYPFIPINA